jgi:hypothetical protein
MSGSEKGGRLDLKQYYSQLEKYETNSNSKSRLRKDNSTSSFSKEPPRDAPATTLKDPHRTTPYKHTFLPERQKIIITDKPASKTILERFESATLDSVKKSRPNEERRFNVGSGVGGGVGVGESLANSGISRKWPTETEEKENVGFTGKEERAFTDHCSQLYRLRPSPALVEDIAREINKRDEVYQVVAAQFPSLPQEKYASALENYFEEHRLMQRIIAEFKAISKLETDDLTELYYFLKTDRE